MTPVANLENDRNPSTPLGETGLALGEKGDSLPLSGGGAPA